MRRGRFVMSVLALMGGISVLVVGGFVFLTLPISNVLNVITVPFGYEYSSCPYCPDFGVKKIEIVACENCGRVQKRGFSGAAIHRGGGSYLFCSNECLDDWKGAEKRGV